MKTINFLTLALAILLATSLTTVSRAAPPKMKMTTEIPPEITIADKVETSIGDLTFEDGFPTEETAQKIYDQLDFQRAVESVMMTTPGASVHAFAQATLVLVDTIGINHVGWGTDHIQKAMPNWFNTFEQFPVLCAKLLEAGFTEQDLIKFIGGNALRVRRMVCGS